MTDAPLDLGEIEARLAKATPGPWDVSYAEDGRVNIDATDDGAGTFFAVVDEEGITFDDATLIAHAPADIRALLDEVRRLEADKAFAWSCVKAADRERDRLSEELVVLKATIVRHIYKAVGEEGTKLLASSLTYDASETRSPWAAEDRQEDET